MKVLLTVFIFQILLLFIRTIDLEAPDECPSCSIPCNPNHNISELSLKRIFSHVDQFHVIALLNAMTGEAYLMCFHLDKLFTRTVSVGKYKMDEVCQVFSSTPSVKIIPTDDKIMIKYDNFPSQELMAGIRSKHFGFSQLIPYFTHQQHQTIDELKELVHRVGVLDRNISLEFGKFNKQLMYLTHQYSAHSQFLDAFAEILGQNFLQFEMRQELEYAILTATIHGLGFRCKPGNYRFRLPCSARGADHCLIDYPNWLYFDLAYEVVMNTIMIYHYDGDNRIVTYSVQVSDDLLSWEDVAIGYHAQKFVQVFLPKPTLVKSIRMRGFNSYNTQFAMYWLKIDWV